MATLSRKSMGIAVRGMEWWSQSTIEHFFYENDVPDRLVDASTSKLKMVLKVFKALETQGDSAKLLDVVHVALPRLRDDTRAELERSLLADGFALAGHALIDAEPEVVHFRSAVLALLRKFGDDLQVGTLSHHLTECEELFVQEKWDSSISHCRNFVEQLLLDLATHIARVRGDNPNLARAVNVRDYLQNVGFLGEAERRRLVDGVYGYFSDEGAHPGVSSHSAARISKNVLLSFAFYVLEKYEGWRNGEFQLT